MKHQFARRVVSMLYLLSILAIAVWLWSSEPTAAGCQEYLQRMRP